TLPGNYTTRISGKQPTGINGEWALEIMKNGDYVILKRISKTQGRVEVRGKAHLNSKHLVTFTKETGPLACKATGKYRWTRTRTRLTFAGLYDTCAGRRVVLGGTFTRVA